MAQAPTRVGPLDQLRSFSSESAEAFTALRHAIEQSGPIEPKNRELIMIGAFATARIEGGFKTHAGRALAAGATADEVRQAATLPLAAQLGIGPVGDALRWADEVISSR